MFKLGTLATRDAGKLASVNIRKHQRVDVPALLLLIVFALWAFLASNIVLVATLQAEYIQATEHTRPRELLWALEHFSTVCCSKLVRSPRVFRDTLCLTRERRKRCGTSRAGCLQMAPLR